MSKGKGKNKQPRSAEDVYNSLKNQGGIIDNTDNKVRFKSWFEHPGNLEKVAALNKGTELLETDFPISIFATPPDTGKLNSIFNQLKNIAGKQQSSVNNVIPIGNVRQENDMSNVKRLNDFLNQENLDQNLSSLKDKAGKLALDATGSFMITNTIANTFKSYKELLSQEDLINLKAALQGGFSDLSNNNSMNKKIMNFNQWFEGLGLSTQKKIIKIVTITPSYLAIVDEKASGKLALNQADLQRKMLQFITDFNSENKATRLLILSYYFLGQTSGNSGNTSSDSDDSDDDSDNDPDVVSTNPYRVYANDLAVAFDNAIGYIVASQLARKAPANTSSIPLSGLPKETQDDILTRYNIPQLMDLRRDQLFVANPLLIPNGYKDQDNMPLINPEADIQRLDESNKILTKELEELKRLMFGYSDALVNPQYNGPSSAAATKSLSSRAVNVRYLTPAEAKLQHELELATKIDEHIKSTIMKQNNGELDATAAQISINQFILDIVSKYNKADKKKRFAQLIKENPSASSSSSSGASSSSSSGASSSSSSVASSSSSSGASSSSSSGASSSSSSGASIKLHQVWTTLPAMSMEMIKRIYDKMNPSVSVVHDDDFYIKWASELFPTYTNRGPGGSEFYTNAIEELNKTPVMDDSDLPLLDGGNPKSHINSMLFGSDISSWTIPRGLI